mgnify:CR=1 FL=1
MTARLQILDARRDQQQIIANLLQLYLYEFSADLKTDVGLDGRFAWDGLEDYWSQDGLHPLLLMVDDKLAGFALVQRIPAADGTLVWDFEDFFVMARYRRRGLGSDAACQLFDRFRGAWQIRVLASNDRGLAFWRSTLSKHQSALELPAEAIVDGRVCQVFRLRS